MIRNFLKIIASEAETSSVYIRKESKMNPVRVFLALLIVLLIVGCSSRKPITLGEITDQHGNAPPSVEAEAALEPAMTMDPVLRDAAESTMACLAVRALGKRDFESFLVSNGMSETQIVGYMSWFSAMHTGCELIVDQELGNK